MRTAWELGSESLFRLPPNFLIWLLAKKLKTKSKNLASCVFDNDITISFPHST